MLPLIARFCMQHSDKCLPICVPPNLVPQVWPHVWQMLRQAFVRTDLGRFSDMENDVFNGSALLWIAWREPEIVAALVTQLREMESGKVCIIGACGGRDARDWIEPMRAIEKFAIDEGCKKIRAIGRKGWVKLIPDASARFVVIEKDLS